MDYTRWHMTSYFIFRMPSAFSEVEHSNLDYQGPDTGEEGLVYRVSKGSQWMGASLGASGCIRTLRCVSLDNSS